MDYPGAGGYRLLPKLRIACSGIAPNTRKKNWVDLAGEDERLRNGMARLYDLFRDAPILGSLIDPSSALENSLFEARFDELRPLLEKAMSAEKDDYEQHELGVAACGIADAVQILGGCYHLIITNVPYLARGKQTNSLKEFCAEYYDEAKNDIATVFLDRLLRLNSPAGTTALVLPQNWLFLTTYKKFRKGMLKQDDGISLLNLARVHSKLYQARWLMLLYWPFPPLLRQMVTPSPASTPPPPERCGKKLNYFEMPSSKPWYRRSS